MKQSETLESFGKLITTSVRDETLSKFDAIAAGRLKSERAVRLREALDTLTAEQLDGIKQVVAGVIDDTIHNVLWMLEQNDEQCQLLHSDGASAHNLVEISDGLSGELYSEDGWIARFSQFAGTE